MTDEQPIVELRDVTKHYDAPESDTPVPVLNKISLAVRPGEALVVTGPSGSGKSTLLNIMGTLDRPSSGQVLLAGQDLSALSDRELSRLRNRDIGFVFQLHHLLPQLSVLENVLVPTIVDPGGSREADERARRLIERVGLAERIHYRPGQLSGGQCQRVALVRALINRPKLLLADEPTGSLDHTTAGMLAGLILELNREEGVTLVVVTHSMELAGMLKRVLALSDGKLEERPGDSA